MSSNERREAAEAELAELKLQQAKAAQQRATESTPQREDKPRNPALMWLGIAVAAAILAGLAYIVTRDGDEVILTRAEEVLELQTACFDVGLFYDDNGACFNDSELTVRNTSVNADVAAAPPTSVEDAASGGGASTPAAPQVPASPGVAAPATTETPATVAADDGATEGSEAPAQPTTAAPTPTTTATTATPTTATPTTATTTTAAPINLDRSGWSLRLSPLAEDGVPCDSDPKPSHCDDALSGQYTIEFAVQDGSLSGAKSGAINGQRVAINGFVNPDGSLQYLTAELQNAQEVTQSFIEMAPGSLTDECNMSGSYAHSIGNPRYIISGTYTMRRSSPGC